VGPHIVNRIFGTCPGKDCKTGEGGSGASSPTTTGDLDPLVGSSIECILDYGFGFVGVSG